MMFRKKMISRAIWFGFLVELACMFLTYLNANACGTMGMDPTCNTVFAIFGWPIVVADSFSENNIFLTLLLGFVIGWTVFSLLIFCVLQLLKNFGNRK